MKKTVIFTVLLLGVYALMARQVNVAGKKQSPILGVQQTNERAVSEKIISLSAKTHLLKAV